MSAPKPQCCCQGEIKLAEVEASYTFDVHPFTEKHTPTRCEVRCANGRALRIVTTEDT